MSRRKRGAAARTATDALPLPVELDIAGVAALHERLVDAQKRSSDLRLSGAEVERAGGAALQLLAAAAVDTRRAGGTLVIDAPSDALRSAADTLGLTATLGL